MNGNGEVVLIENITDYANGLFDGNISSTTVVSLICVFFVLGALIVALAAININLSLAKAIIKNKNSWKSLPKTELMYSFASLSGQYQRRCIYVDAHKLLFDKTSSLISFAGFGYKLGVSEKESRILAFLLSFPYMILSFFGIFEMIIRCVAGTVFYFVLNIIYMLILAVAWVINLILIAAFGTIDKLSAVHQHCPNCYSEYTIPTVECKNPQCGKMHDNLRPGKAGVLWAKCSCGKFIPCSYLTKRKYLKSFCPKCGCELVTSSIKALTLQVVGGNSSGKTAFISAFQHQYIETINNKGIRDINCSPEDGFDALNRMYLYGYEGETDGNKVNSYYIYHENGIKPDDGFVIYDVPDEFIMNEQYERNPMFFAYCDGIIMIIDPLSVEAVRNACQSRSGAVSISGYSDDSPEKLIINFISKYSEVSGRSASKMIETPLAVVITKTDLDVIKEKVGIDTIRMQCNFDSGKYEDFSDACNQICRRYLSEIGLLNTLNILDSVFTNISFFPVSSIGHVSNGSQYSPKNVITPIQWLAGQCKSNVTDLIKIVKEESKK